MKKNFFIKFCGLAVAVGTLLTPVNVIAENPAHTYTPIHGTTTSFNEYVVFEENASVPDVEMTFSIQSGAVIPYTNSTVAVFAGPDADKITISKTTFSNADTSSGLPVNTTVCPVYEDLGNISALEYLENRILRNNFTNKYVVKTSTINLSLVTFDEPGIYRYILRQSLNSDFLYPDINIQTNTRYLDVYVTDNGSGVLTVASYTLREEPKAIQANATKGSSDVPTAGDPLDDKSDGFTNWYASAPVEFTDVTTGNQGSKDKYFKYTVNFSGLQPNYQYKVDISNAEATTTDNAATVEANIGKQNASSFTTDANGAKTMNFYLKDSQSIRIWLPIGTFDDFTYTSIPLSISVDKEDYHLDISGYTNKSGCSTVEGDTLNTVVYDVDSIGRVTRSFSPYANDGIVFTLTRDGVVPTGIVVPVAAAVVISVVAMIGLLAKRKKEDEE